jgi:hypothetical protein
MRPSNGARPGNGGKPGGGRPTNGKPSNGGRPSSGSGSGNGVRPGTSVRPGTKPTSSSGSGERPEYGEHTSDHGTKPEVGGSSGESHKPDYEARPDGDDGPTSKPGGSQPGVITRPGAKPGSTTSDKDHTQKPGSDGITFIDEDNDDDIFGSKPGSQHGGDSSVYPGTRNNIHLIS